MIRKTYRVTIDCEVQFDDVTMERAREYMARRAEARAEEPHLHVVERCPSEADIAAQRALQVELERMPEQLDLWLKDKVWLEVVHGMEYEQCTFPSDRVILHPAIERLPPRERHWWRQTLDSGDDTLFERWDDMLDAVTADIRGVTIRQVEP